MSRDSQAVRYELDPSADEPFQPQAPDGVGRILARARQELGYELSGVAAELRIRLPYLQAIEEERYQDLPGMPYAIGFVRSYAEFVGLDPDATVALFKTEVRDLANAHQNLTFPAPKPEGRIPGGALVLISLLVVALAYGGWYLWNGSGRSLVELLPSLNGSQVAEAPRDAAAPASGGASTEPAAGSLNAAGVERAPIIGEPGPVAGPVAGGGASAIAPSAPAVEDDPAAEEGSELPAAPTVLEQMPPAAPPLAETAAEEAAEEAADAVPSVPGPTAEEALDEEAPEAAEAPAAVTGAGVPAALNLDTSGQVYGEEGTPVRVVLVASADSWVQVRGSDDELLFTRVLRPGDSYRVPDSTGLTLLTGNAGGLHIVVDGQQMPSLGPQGSVRRNIPLDVDALRNTLN